MTVFRGIVLIVVCQEESVCDNHQTLFPTNQTLWLVGPEGWDKHYTVPSAWQSTWWCSSETMGCKQYHSHGQVHWHWQYLFYIKTSEWQ